MIKPGGKDYNIQIKGVYIFLIIFGLLFLIIYSCNHYFFRTYAFDYGAYNFAFYDYAHFRNSPCPVYHIDARFIQDHASFTLIILSPLYWLFSWITGTYTLLIFQTSLILFGAWGVYKLIALKTENKILPILALLYYFLVLGRWTAFTSDCNFAIIASSVVPVFMYFFERKKWPAFVLCFIFILTTREDMALWTLFIGIFYLVIYRKDKERRKASAWIIFTSLVYFILTFTLIIPLLETPGKKFLLFNYSMLGENPLEALLFMVRHPFKALQLLFVNFSGEPLYDKVKTEFYLVYLLSGGILVFLRPAYLLLFVPILAKKMLNDDPIRWSVELYYSIEFVTILPVAVYGIISSFRNRKLQTLLGVIICVVTLMVSAHKLTGKRELKWWPVEKYAFWQKEMYSSGVDISDVYESLKRIPDDAKVSASCRIVPHLAFRKTIYYFPRVDDAEYLVVFRENDTYPLNLEQFEKELQKYTDSEEWVKKADEGDILLLMRKTLK